MRRDPGALTDVVWDVVVVGGGIHGACLAWEAVLRGLTVCLLEKRDFGSGTSANSMKIIHGGLRYLQHLDYRRARDSMRERRTLLRIAPHLVQPLPVLVPTYGHGRRGRELLQLALLVNDVVGLDRNRGLDRDQRIPRSQMISPVECRRRLPDLASAQLSGAAIFYDAQVYSSERLLVAFLRSATKAGAEVANDVEVVGILRHREQVVGVRAVDGRSGQPLVIRSRTVVNATGPAADHILDRAAIGAGPGAPLARAVNVVTRRALLPCAVGLPATTTYRDAAGRVRHGSRMLFIVPWRDGSLVGTWYAPHDRGLGDVAITEGDVTTFLHEVNEVHPELAISLDDVAFVHAGLVPLTGTEPGPAGLPLATSGWIIDHTSAGWPGLFTLVGVKYTTARLMAERVVTRLIERLGRPRTSSVSAVIPLHGGDVGRLSTFVEHQTRRPTPGLGGRELIRLIRSYGSAYGEVLTHADRSDDERFATSLAEVRHAIRAEMAHTLADIVFRRTEFGSAGHPGDALLGACTKTAAAELGWDDARVTRELGEVHARCRFPR